MRENRLILRGDKLEVLLQLAKTFFYVAAGSGILFAGAGIMVYTTKEK